MNKKCMLMRIGYYARKRYFKIELRHQSFQTVLSLFTFPWPSSLNEPIFTIKLSPVRSQRVNQDNPHSKSSQIKPQPTHTRKIIGEFVINNFSALSQKIGNIISIAHKKNISTQPNPNLID